MNVFEFDLVVYPEEKKGIAKTFSTPVTKIEKKKAGLINIDFVEEYYRNKTARHKEGMPVRIHELFHHPFTFNQYKQFFRNRAFFPGNFKDGENYDEANYNSIVAQLKKIETIDENGTVTMVQNPDNEVTLGGVINDIIGLYETVYDSIEKRFNLLIDDTSEVYQKFKLIFDKLKDGVESLEGLNAYQKIEIVNDWHLPDWIAVSKYIEKYNDPEFKKQSLEYQVSQMPNFDFTPEEQLRIAEAKALRNTGVASQLGGKTRRKKRTKKRKTKTKKRKKRKTNKKRKRKTKKRKTNKKKR